MSSQERTTPLSVARPAPDSRVPSPDEAAHLDGLLMHELSTLNYRLGQYVLRFYDADAGRAAPVSLTDERALADWMTTAADVLRTRAKRRVHKTDDDAPAEEGM
jgi:hypothetical protein